MLLAVPALAQTKTESGSKWNPKTAKADGKIVPAQVQVDEKPFEKAVDTRTFEERARQYRIQLEPPRPERVFQIESEATLRQRMRQEARQREERIEFPKDVYLIAPGEVYAGRKWPMQSTATVPNIVCYRPLYFEDLNSERYGWDACLFQPFLSTGKFYLDTLMLPYNMGVLSPCDCECNTGYYLPGTPVPYMCYVPPLSWKGILYQSAAIAIPAAIWP
jgi:hypothetical protein